MGMKGLETMETEKKENPFVRIDSFQFEGKTIKKAMFVTINESDKFYLVFDTDEVMVLPVHRQCPVQIGTLTDLMGDSILLKQSIEKEMHEFCSNRMTLLKFVESLGGN